MQDQGERKSGELADWDGHPSWMLVSYWVLVRSFFSGSFAKFP